MEMRRSKKKNKRRRKNGSIKEYFTKKIVYTMSQAMKRSLLVEWRGKGILQTDGFWCPKDVSSGYPTHFSEKWHPPQLWRKLSTTLMPPKVTKLYFFWASFLLELTILIYNHHKLNLSLPSHCFSSVCILSENTEISEPLIDSSCICPSAFFIWIITEVSWFYAKFIFQINLICWTNSNLNYVSIKYTIINHLADCVIIQLYC